MNDEEFVERIVSLQRAGNDASSLDQKTQAIARLGSLIALDATPPSYEADASMALACGVTVDEIVGALIAVAHVVGSAKVVSAAGAIALALGYDIDADLEAIDSLGQ